MTDRLHIALAQINPTVGDVAGNTALILRSLVEAGERGADLVVFPELCVSGYPPEDLVTRRAYAEGCQRAVAEIAAATEGGPAAVIGCPWPSGNSDPRPYNAAILCAEGGIAGVVPKRHLPDYSVFDEPRTFQAGKASGPISWCGLKLGLMTCEDMWFPGPAADLAAGGAEILIAPHGSPFRTTAHAERLFQAELRAGETSLPVVFVNQVGGQDELVFDGGAFTVQPGGAVWRAPVFREEIFSTHWQRGEAGWHQEETGGDWDEGEALLYQALVTGTRDYVRKSGFKSVVLGLSGGIDSAMVAAVAVDALGPDNVLAVMMPSRYTSTESLEDAEACAKALGIRYESIGIEPGVGALTEMLAPMFEGLAPDTTEENLQSRLRGVTLMALSNKFGALLLSTGNKSEMAVGYATLYGDMNGAYNPLKDVYKTLVFDLARWRNGAVPEGALGPSGEVIPVRIIEKPPSAELRDDQKDEDSLPPYEVLDDILDSLIEEEASVDDIAAKGHPRELAAKIQHMLYLAEYKRRQSPPGPKITTRNFGRDRRYPIINGWRERD